MSWRKIKVFFLDHWPKVAIVVSIVLMIWWPLAVLSKIDSYQRSYLIAWTSMMPASAAINAVIFVVLYSWVLQGGFAKMRKSSIKGEDVRIHWKDVIGMEGAKMEAREMVELIKDRAKLKKIGGLTMLEDALERIRVLGMTPVLGDGVSMDIGCWMEACVAARSITNAGEMNGFLKAREQLFSRPLGFEDGAIVLPAGYWPEVDRRVLAAHVEKSERFGARAVVPG